MVFPPLTKMSTIARNRTQRKGKYYRVYMGEKKLKHQVVWFADGKHQLNNIAVPAA